MVRLPNHPPRPRAREAKEYTPIPSKGSSRHPPPSHIAMGAADVYVRAMCVLPVQPVIVVGRPADFTEGAQDRHNLSVARG